MTNHKPSEAQLDLSDSRKLTIIISLVTLCLGIATWSLTKTSEVSYKLGEMAKQVQINTDKLNVGKRFTWEDGVVQENRFNNTMNDLKLDFISRMTAHETRIDNKIREAEERTQNGFGELKQQIIRLEEKMDDYFGSPDSKRKR